MPRCKNICYQCCGNRNPNVSSSSDRSASHCQVLPFVCGWTSLEPVLQSPRDSQDQYLSLYPLIGLSVVYYPFSSLFYSSTQTLSFPIAFQHPCATYFWGRYNSKIQHETRRFGDTELRRRQYQTILFAFQDCKSRMKALLLGLHHPH